MLHLVQFQYLWGLNKIHAEAPFGNPFFRESRIIPITGRNGTLAAKKFLGVARRKTDGYL